MVPIVYVHSGNQKYLRCAIKSAQNVGEETFLIGDNSNRNLCEKWVDAQEFEDNEYKRFQKVYVHMSTNSEKFEMACFRRYFSLKRFMEKYSILKCIMLDSDILLEKKITDIASIANSDVAFSVPSSQKKYDWVASPHVFVCTYQLLCEFIEFIIDTYTNNIEILKQKYKFHLKNNIKGGICDMTLMFLWSQKVKYTNLYNCSELFFDHTLQEKQGMKFDKVLNMKKIYRLDGNLGFLDEQGSFVCTAIMHFQGSTKSVMPDYFYGNPYIICVIHRYADLFLRGIKRFTGR